jgi:Protein of unknown function (DUF4199)
MFKNPSPAVKGLITGILMIVSALIIFYTDQPPDSPLQYLIYIIYAGGIIWTVVSHSYSASFAGKFSDLFSQGFRCFIVVTLLMVLFTGLFIKMHPEFAIQEARAYKEQLIKQKNKTPDEIDEIAAKVEKQYMISHISVSIFGYLIIGAGITAIVSALLIRRK